MNISIPDLSRPSAKQSGIWVCDKLSDVILVPIALFSSLSRRGLILVPRPRWLRDEKMAIGTRMSDIQSSKDENNRNGDSVLFTTVFVDTRL